MHKNALDAKQIADNKKKIADFEAQRETVLADFDKDEASRNISQLENGDDFIEDPTGAEGTFKQAIPDQDDWEVGEPELLSKEEPTELSGQASSVGKTSTELSYLKSRLAGPTAQILSLSQISRLIKAVKGRTKIGSPSSEEDTTKTSLLDLIFALKKIVAFYDEQMRSFDTPGNKSSTRTKAALATTILALQRTIAILLMKE